VIRIVFLILISSSVLAQEAPRCVDPAFNSKVKDYVKGTVALIDADELAAGRSQYLILDARESDEYEVSHIEGAKRIGYDDPDYEVLIDVPNDTEIVVYCSIGYRSEKIGEKLMERGYKNVRNLYGGIFEWSNRAYPLIDTNGTSTRELHTYSRSWSKWADSDKVNRTW